MFSCNHMSLQTTQAAMLQFTGAGHLGAPWYNSLIQIWVSPVTGRTLVRLVQGVANRRNHLFFAMIGCCVDGTYVKLQPL